MNPKWRQKAARHPVTKAVLHPAITLAGLLMLLLLIFFGTLYQADHGLYEAQRVFFGYLIWVAGVVPFPGSSLVLWVLSIQLAVMMTFVLPLVWKKAGLWVVHGGLLLLLVGGFITQMMAVESQMTLAEGETGHYTMAYDKWEVAVWRQIADTNEVLAYVDEDLQPGAVLDLAPWPARLTVVKYHENAAAFTSTVTGGVLPYLNASGIASMEPRKPEKEAPQNAPGLIAKLSVPNTPDREILLYGLESRPLALTLGGERVLLQLRRRHYPLDFSLTLKDFIRTLHPGTDVARSYESYVDLHDGLSSRPVKVWMNNPLRYKGYTFFQASFAIDQEGEHSTFAVVTNPGRLIPYISSLMVFGGMLLHFILHFLGYVRRTARK
ncbi:MAG: hypothetical protein K0Q91_1990 [Fibrobacteria bacterium]|jgi:hypothetical protein|nr:hypothetical protein [Fibrobacteria bacterium]